MGTCLWQGGCKDIVHSAKERHDDIDNRIESLQSYLAKGYERITAAAGGASKVYAVAHPNILSDQRRVPLDRDCSMMSIGDPVWLIPKVRRLANAIKNAAASSRVNVIDVSGAFAGHELCTQTPYATELHRVG